MANKPISVTIKGDYSDKDIKRAIRDLGSLQKQGPATAKATKTVTDSMKGLGLAFGAVAVATGMKRFISNAVTMGLEANKTVNRLTAIAKSMGILDTVLDGNVKGLTGYAQQLQNVTAVSDETVKSGQAILLTFKDIASTAGDRGGLFDRATLATLDLQAAGFGDVSSSAKALGRALQDPIKGLTALSRQGVTFTAQEREKVKALMAANRTFEAQKIIMDAVESQVGGTAAAVATEFDKMARSLEDAQENIGLGVIALGDQVVKSFGSNGEGGIMQAVLDWTENFRLTMYGLAMGWGGFIDELTIGAINVQDFFGTIGDAEAEMMRQDIEAKGAARDLRIAQEALGLASDGTAKSVSGSADAAGEMATGAAKATTQVSRLKSALDKLTGKVSIKRQRLNIQQMLAEGPAQSGERTVVGADGKETTKRFSTKADKKSFALDLADARIGLADDLFNRGGGGKEAKAAARSQFRLGRGNLAGLNLGDYTNGLLATPDEFRASNARGGQQVVADRMSGSTNNYYFGDLFVKDMADAAEQAKRAARLKSLGSGRQAEAARYSAMAG